ncbi:hypothetical protein FISHEDRAFT_44388, partial [Fistulina hepatica ATCC 64428]
IFGSYDIMCQYSKNFFQRMNTKFPGAWFIDTAQVTWNWLVPKFHLIAHVLKCRLNFSFNFERGVGRTEGEAPERNWGSLNPLASQTKEMGPG